MEIAIIGIVIVVAGIALLFGGGNSNDLPVEQWSDEKLARMHRKLSNAAKYASKANKTDEATRHYQKADEVNRELVKRLNAKEDPIENFVSGLQDLEEDKIPERMINKVMEIAKDKGIPEAEASEIFSKKCDELFIKYKSAEIPENETDKKALLEALSMKY